MARVTCGMKLIDVQAIDLKPNDSLLNFQSQELFFVFECNLMKVTKEGYGHFKHFLDLIEKIGKDSLPFCSCGLKTRTMQVKVTADSSATYDFLMRGGACKIATFLCHCCSVKSNDLAHFKVEDEYFKQFKLDGNDSCMCWTELDNEHAQKLSMHSRNFVKEKNNEGLNFFMFRGKIYNNI